MKKKTMLGYAALVFIFMSSSIAANPCSLSVYCYDPDGGQENITNFNNPHHYVFIGAHPDDELFVYPMLKNYCAENNAYCALIITSRGRGGCDKGIDQSACANIREVELKNSADYLEADLWHFDFPDGELEIYPYTWAGVVAAYNQSSSALGYSNTVEMLKSLLKELKSNSSPLVLITHNPDHGSTGHLDHKVLSALAINAIIELKVEFPISHFQIESLPIFTISGPAVGRKENVNPICLNGLEKLTASNTDMTNFDVFNHGYNAIYLSQIWHLGLNSNDAGSYNFCYK